MQKNKKMQNLFSKYLAVLMVFSVLMANAALSFADNLNTGEIDVLGAEIVEREGGGLNKSVDSGVNYDGLTGSSDSEVNNDGVNDNSDENKAEDKNDDSNIEQQFLMRIKQELSLSKTDYQQLLNRISDTKKRIDLINEERISLKIQIENIEAQEDIMTDKLFTVIKQIIEKENSIFKIYAEIEDINVDIELQKELLRDYVRIIYTEENDFFNTGDDGSMGTLRLLLLDSSVGENLRKLDNLNLLNEAGQQIVERLNELNTSLEFSTEKLLNERQNLEVLRIDLNDNKNELAMQRDSKEKLLELTAGQEVVYQRLLEESLTQQEGVVAEITKLNEIKIAAEKSIENGVFDYDALNSMFESDDARNGIMNFYVDHYGTTVSRFNWPVMPKRGISAFFRNNGDGYKARFGVQHSAIDIPTAQGSPIYAPADAVVYSAKDNGYGYSYIILSHAGGFTTTYGHVSSILVKPGQFIPSGAIIGLTGGMPGTLGAGYMTTGPHLHFEMRLNGSYVDPIYYLPIETLDKDDLIEKYHDEWDAAVLEMETSRLLER